MREKMDLTLQVAECNDFSLLQQFSCHRFTGCSISGCLISGFPSRLCFNQSTRGSEIQLGFS